MQFPLLDWPREKEMGKKRKSRFLSAEMGQILASQPGDKNRRLLYRVNIKPHEGQRRKGGVGETKSEGEEKE